MTHGAHEAAGAVLDAGAAWIFLGVWASIVLAHGLWRSLGEAKQDPIRPSGPVD